jgi:L-rhamnose mutarotase
MERVAFKMKLYEGRVAEYKKRHDELWPELRSLLKKAGVKDYAIYFDEDTHILFGVLKLNNRRDYDALPSLRIMQKWWAYMADIMETNDDNSPVAKPLEEVFYLL